MGDVPWFGLESVEVRFNQARAAVPGRTAVRRNSLGRMQVRWLTGTVFNSAVGSGDRVGTRALTDFADLDRYREAHNDYVQTLVETGGPGCSLRCGWRWPLSAPCAAIRGSSPPLPRC
jgi:hypothetical protein